MLFEYNVQKTLRPAEEGRLGRIEAELEALRGVGEDAFPVACDLLVQSLLTERAAQRAAGGAAGGGRAGTTRGPQVPLPATAEDAGEPAGRQEEARRAGHEGGDAAPWGGASSEGVEAGPAAGGDQGASAGGGARGSDDDGEMEQLRASASAQARQLGPSVPFVSMLF